MLYIIEKKKTKYRNTIEREVKNVTREKKKKRSKYNGHAAAYNYYCVRVRKTSDCLLLVIMLIHIIVFIILLL